MSEKDFLSQFSSDGKKPDSFKEEERIKIEKPKKEINPKAIIIAALVLVVLGVLSYFLFFAPKIEMPDFVGQTKDDVASWVKQQGITSSGIVFKEEYNFDNAENVILSQDVKAGKKVKKDVKVTFAISLGADPDEKITLPDIKNMTKSELETWISDNKLTKTKITTTYNDSYEKDTVISYELKGVDEDSFTRSSTLNISISKGPQPAGTVTVSDFKGKSYSEAETWANKNKVTLVKVESYSSTVESGNIISQSISANSSMKTGDTLTITVSKGKGVTLPNFVSMSEKQYDSWKKKNPTVSIDEQEIYSNTTAHIISQSVASGTMVGSDDVVTVVKNLGNGFYYTDECSGYNSTYDKLVDWANNEAKEKGLNVTIEKHELEDTSPRGTILGVWDIHDSEKSYSSAEKLPLTVTIVVRTSMGYVNSAPAPTTSPDGDGEHEDPIISNHKLTQGDVDALANKPTYANVLKWMDDNPGVASKMECRQTIDGKQSSCTLDENKKYDVHFEKENDYGAVVEYAIEVDKEIPEGSTIVLIPAE